jgi:orotidine-5'-phosphate decarboxylase
VNRESVVAGPWSPLPGPVSARLIVALDVPSVNDAAALLGLLRPAVEWFKIGPELFTAAGPDAVEMVHHRGGRVFLDLKYHDIPNTVAGAVAAAAALGVAMLNVHIAGGREMLRAAVEARPEAPGPRPIILGVTLLTSDPDPGSESVVLQRARMAHEAGLDGVVASAQEAAVIKAAFGREFLVVAPGIRRSAADQQDQRRVMTVAAAIAAGSDFLVVGRPITQAGNPRQAAEALLEEIARARPES